MYPKHIEDLLKPNTVDEALALLAKYGTEARIIAGGQSLMPLLKLRMAEPRFLIDLNHVASLPRFKKPITAYALAR